MAYRETDEEETNFYRNREPILFIINIEETSEEENGSDDWPVTLE
jgi:hypothetical protein